MRVEDVKNELFRESELPQRLRCALYVDLFRANRGLEQLFEPQEYQELGCAPYRSVTLEGRSRLKPGIRFRRYEAHASRSYQPD